MLRYKTETRPGLVALYDIRPGNGAGPFLQPRNPHGAILGGQNILWPLLHIFRGQDPQPQDLRPCPESNLRHSAVLASLSGVKGRGPACRIALARSIPRRRVSVRIRIF